MLLKTNLILLSILSFASTAFGQRPNHLVPIPAYEPDGYDQAVFHALIGGGLPELWMVCEPSFSPEYALILRSEALDPKAANRRGGEKRKWILEVATATKQIWHKKEDRPGVLELDLLRDVPVDRKRIEIDEPLAKALKAAWDAVLRLTRYPDEDQTPLGGVMYQFYAHYNRFGQTWTPTARDRAILLWRFLYPGPPETGLPADIVALGERLMNVVDRSPVERQSILVKCGEAAKHLEDAANTARAESKARQPSP
jgi:hypothetical protein